MNLYDALGNAAINEETKEDFQKIILKSESFIDDVLHEHLKERQKKRDEILQDIFDMEILVANLKLLIDMKDQKEVETLTQLGCDSYVYADILDKNKIFIQIGYEFYLEMTLENAISFLKKKISLYEEKLTYWNKEIAKIKAHIQILMRAISNLA
ncbi:prefoldin, putative [Plasmodium vinckei]|uniref:Prefoldin, putative n=6 Tax=Plasmodium (Vinckeia) TaxID=418101 RepID=A0A077XED9_PLACU|nr:prefoldin, putative [Plasmodium vinckei vinckei]XP_016655294.1 prefoldin, putative [Plasmodium chabaudi chabaudi]CAD2103522.1 prefoldin, putative [Plasmodium vinckei]CAD2103599.1 prefoldin, putative [Plasmodium vinckei petteri]SCM20683.1 prefoldin, putative [Plasmodium chabaudi adami]KEG02019.1 prefoldin, alpha subunit [Plasmodium vinckei vinckei]SCM21762.1 prefoldin, putative [Plasmodium chabaudi chabaudi]|eukprot:XP_016655294.1 prefoldin, putative [Plasmodium chabaudi chabaudi]